MQQQKNAVLSNAKNSPAESSFEESSILTLAENYGWITLVVTVTAVAINFFFILTGLAPGDITGPSPVRSTALGIPASTMSLCVSIPLLILSTIVLGKSLGIRTLYITLATPLFMELILSIHTTQFLLDIHPLLKLAVAGLLGGLLVEAAISIALNHICATGGMDVIALSIQYVFKFPKVSVILFFLDDSVVIASGVVAQSALISVFSFPSLMVITQAISFVTKYKLSA